MIGAGDRIVFENVSKFYGEILGVNRVDLDLGPGITGLVGPNGSGKSTLLNLMAGFLRPSRGRVSVLGIPPDDPERLWRHVGYCTQFDSFPRGLTGRQLLLQQLRLHGLDPAAAARRADEVLEQMGLAQAAHRRVAAYSKGMRQRIKLAVALAHRPRVLILDEPLNGLDPLARAETIDHFKEAAREGAFVVISSHVLHEVDLISDQVVLLHEGYVVAEGDIQGVREEMISQPFKIRLRCDRPALVAARAFQTDSVLEAVLHDDRGGLDIRTRDLDGFYLQLNRIVLEERLQVESVAPADDDVQSVYRYLVGPATGGAA